MESRPTVRQPGLIVFLCGLGTSFLTLYLVNVLEDHGTNIMGWYANAIIPVGAILVGLASGSGYAIGSRVLHAKLHKGYVLGMLVTGVLDWFGLRWMNYTNLLERQHISADRVSYLDYLRFISEHMAFKSSSSSGPGTELGMVGYVYKLLEIAGFAGGVMIPCLILMNQPYCKRCQVYLAKVLTSHLHSTATAKEVRALRKQQRKEALTNAIAEVGAKAQPLIETLAGMSYSETHRVISELEKKTSNSAASITFTLKKCPTCESHHVAVQLCNVTIDKKQKITPLAKFDKTGDQPVAATIQS